MKVIGLLSLLLVASPVMAGNIWCTGKLANVYISRYGDVTILGEWHPSWTTICNIKTGAGADIPTCTLWASYAAMAVKEQLPVKLMYAGTNYQCATLPGYNNAPAPEYLMLLAPSNT